MGTFVLVHGAWHGGWCYGRTAKILRAQGHDVFTPTMTGVGERSHLDFLPVNLSLHIQDIVNVLKWENLSDVVLCGHSYGGMVITGVADSMPERVRALVYLDAFVPENGKSLWDYVVDEYRNFFMDSSATNHGLKTNPIPGEAFKVNPQDVAWVNEKCVPMSVATFIERIALTGAYRKVPKRMYIYAQGWAPSPLTQFYEQFKGDPDWTVRTSQAGHDVMVDDPEGLASMLLAAL